jgi:hypothetical protein
MTETATTVARALVANAADEEQVKGADRKEKIGDRQAASDLRELLKQPVFKRFLWRVLGQCREREITLPGSGTEAVWFNEGRRNVAAYLHAEINKADPLAYPRMMLEAEQEAHGTDG